MVSPRAESGTAKSLQCMEIWGGNEAFDNAFAVPGIDAWVFSEPCPGSDSGGDIHYVSLCGGGNIARFVVADVAGHGASASDLAVALRKLMRRFINRVDQTRFVRALNKHFSQSAEDGKFATALLATYFAPTDHLIVCNAGHPKPLWYRAATRNWIWLQEDVGAPREEMKGWPISNLPLGIIEPTSYYQFAVPLEKDDLVVIYTDSVIESKNPAGRLLGSEGLLEIVQGIDPVEPAGLREALLDEVAGFRKNAPADDDLTLIVLHHNAGAPPRHSMGEMVRVMGKMLGIVKV